MSLISRFRQLFRASNQTDQPDLDDYENIDPNNPFPEVVVIEFRDVLDLHSIPPAQVRAVVEDYLEEARRRGVRGVRIIHGKGIGVQREIVRSILSRTPYVAHFSDAPGEAGGWGATVVTFLAVKKDEGREGEGR
jgi:dsDNA-specific endonuclease/ATPase MutS2